MTKLNVSVAIKLTIARFLNSSVVLVIANYDARFWFKDGSLVYDATVLIFFMAFLNPLLYIIDPWGCYKKRQISKAKALPDEECKVTQREANQLHEFPIVDAANNISNYINLILTCIFYSPIIPLTIPIALIGSILNYWVYKYMLLRRHKMPEMFSTMMATFFANSMPFVLIVWGISFLIFVQKIHEAFWDEYYSK